MQKRAEMQQKNNKNAKKGKTIFSNSKQMFTEIKKNVKDYSDKGCLKVERQLHNKGTLFITRSPAKLERNQCVVQPYSEINQVVCITFANVYSPYAIFLDI